MLILIYYRSSYVDREVLKFHFIIWRGFAPGFLNYKKKMHSTRSRKLKSLPVACPWSMVLSGNLTSSTTKTGRHDIAEILLKVALNTKNLIIKSNLINFSCCMNNLLALLKYFYLILSGNVHLEIKLYHICKYVTMQLLTPVYKAFEKK